MEYTPEIINELKYNEVFVFGSNESGIHGAGAARLAFDKFGAKWGQGLGHTGQAFAIPTKDWKVQSLPTGVIGMYFGRFLAYAKARPKLKFFVTKIGCGLAGLDVADIAPLIHVWGDLPPNVVIPKEFSKEEIIRHESKKFVDYDGKI